MTAPRTGQVTDEYTGLPVPGASIYVYNQDGTAATVYSDVGLTSVLAQPLTTDQFGNYTYYAAVEYYREDTWYGGKLRYRESNIAIGSPGADLNLRSDLAANTGAGLVGNKSSLPGAQTRTLAQILSDWVSVKDFNAKLDANADGSTGTDDTAAWTAAFNALATTPGTLIVPAGNSKVTSHLTVPNNVTIRGAGQKATNIIGTHAGGGGANAAENARNGSIFYNAQPINTSGGANLAIESIRLFNSNAANQGAGFYQQSGVIVTLQNVECGGSKWGVILDQSEDVIVDKCILASNVAGGAALWIVNGPDLNPSAQSGFSNIIAVRDSELNVIPTSYGIVDDGGYSHTFSGCNFVTGINGIRASGVNGLTISDFYFESQVGDCIVLANTTLSGVGSSAPTTTLMGGWATRAANKALVKGVGSGGEVRVFGAYSNDSGAPLIQGAGTFYSVIVSANVPGDPPLTDGDASTHTLILSKIYADTAGHSGIPSNGTNGGVRFTPATSAGYIETFNPSGVRQGYFGFLQGAALQFGAEGTADHFEFLKPVLIQSYTVATLPASPPVGTRAFVSDANAATFGSAVAGGGSNKVPVYYDGAWKIG